MPTSLRIPSQLTPQCLHVPLHPYFLKMKGKEKEDTECSRHLLVHSSTAHNSRAWVTLQSGDRNCIQVDGRDPSTLVTALTGSCAGSRIARIQIRHSSMGCGYPKGQLNHWATVSRRGTGPTLMTHRHNLEHARIPYAHQFTSQLLCFQSSSLLVA